MNSLAQKYGVGIVLTEKLDDVESWEILPVARMAIEEGKNCGNFTSFEKEECNPCHKYTKSGIPCPRRTCRKDPVSRRDVPLNLVGQA
jgi:hypothetical protein